MTDAKPITIVAPSWPLRVLSACHWLAKNRSHGVVDNQLVASLEALLIISTGTLVFFPTVPHPPEIPDNLIQTGRKHAVDVAEYTLLRVSGELPAQELDHCFKPLGAGYLEDSLP